MFNALGVLPKHLQDVTVVREKTDLLIPSINPDYTRHEVLQWLESEFFPYEEQPYITGAAEQDVAIIRSSHLPKPILITIVPEGAR